MWREWIGKKEQIRRTVGKLDKMVWIWRRNKVKKEDRKMVTMTEWKWRRKIKQKEEKGGQSGLG